MSADLFFEYSLDLLAVASTDGYFKRVNPSFERVLGFTPEELYAKPMVAFMHPDDVAPTRRGIAILAEGISRITSVNRYLCKDGTCKWFSWNTIPVGETLYTAGREITDQVKAEEKIRQLNSELEKKNEELERKVQERVADLRNTEAQVQQLQKMDAIGRLAGGVAHDFNNMLGAITMYCDLLVDDVKDPALVQGHTQDILDVAERGAALTRQLLVFSRKQVIVPQVVQLNPLIEQLKKMLVRIIGEQNEIVTKLAPDLKRIRVDPSQMEQVLMNLVVNARDAMPSGGRVTIETSNVLIDESFASTHLTADPGPYVLLSVTDTGCGMDAATRSKIFEPFFTTKAVGKGTGLGLTTTYGIVKQCRGMIWVYSEPGAGTVFKIYLPISEDAASEVSSVPTKTGELPSVQTLLLVEDDPHLREGFANMLRKRGYQVLVASEAQQALQLLEEHSEPIHLLMTDVIMPGLNGFELAKRAAAKRGGLRVLYMSGYTSDALETSGTVLTDEMDFIQKPFTASELLRKLGEIFSRE